MNVRIVSDSTADIAPDAAKALGVEVVPLNVIFGEEAYRDGVDINGDSFYSRLEHSSVFPSTSQPSPAAFLDVYRRLAKDGADAIVSIHLSAGLSGTFQSASVARQQCDQTPPIFVVDSRTISLALGMIVTRAARLAAANATADEIVLDVEDASLHNRVYFMVDTLEYVRRGGRIGRAAALLGSVLQIKPILTLEAGLVVPASRPRTRQRAIADLVRLASLHSHVGWIGIAYTTAEEEAATLRAQVEERFPGVPILAAQVGPVLGAHVGPRALGLCVMESGVSGRQIVD